ncbi:MAG: hypothetical protein LBD41_06020 [Clostridiales Family XIII bacterium]|nr:hypothetical protein [Clostridiales Family XIII bacterium]
MKGLESLIEAFDKIVNRYVSADWAKQNSCLEKYRFTCGICGEDVYLAAASINAKRIAHFRHRKGNNEKECENYIKMTGRNTGSLKEKKRNRVDFYYNIENRNFNIGLKFTDVEIEEYGDKEAYFKLTYENGENTFDAIEKQHKIHSGTFAHNDITQFAIDKYALSYYFSINVDTDAPEKYDIFYDNKPTFFKLLGNDNKLAKMIRTETLYTNTSYFIVNYDNLRINEKNDDINILANMQFKTMDLEFKGLIIEFLKNTPRIHNILHEMGYKLVDAATLTFLWPPGLINKDAFEIESDNVFLYTDLILQPGSNIKIASNNLKRDESSNLYMVAVKEPIEVYDKNITTVIKSKKREFKHYDKFEFSNENHSKYIVPDKSISFLFNSFGAVKLSSGQTIYLTEQSVIKHFNGSYLYKEILPNQAKELNREELLIDILKHIKRMEACDVNVFKKIPLSDCAKKYVSECETSGLINSVAKDYILEGKI